jgi:Flp pilus assembly protein TadG
VSDSAPSRLVNIGTEVGKVFARDDAGQTVVLVALMFTVLMGFAALGIDVGRFYSERRFIQSAVDSAALACAYKYSGGGLVSDAWAAADAVLQNRTLKSNPLGIDTPYAALGSEVYDPTVEDHNLISGILPVQTNGRGCRVAITVAVPTFLIKIVSPALNTITMTTSAYAKSKSGMLPTVVNRYANPPGPGNGNTNQFIDHLMAGPCSGCAGTAGFDYQCTVANAAPCTPATEANPGREFVIFGQAAKATNDASFRGYIALDIRDFTTTDWAGLLIHDAYNSVPATASIQILKDYEAAWVLEAGYPGPDICVVQAGTFLPCAQLAVINGSSSGQFVDDYTTRFHVGDKLLLQMYDGTVKTVPDFNITSGTLTLPAIGTRNSTIQYTMSPQFAISWAQVMTTLIPDDGQSHDGRPPMTDDGGGTVLTNPFLNGCSTFGTFSSNPTPVNSTTYTQNWTGITTSGCDRGIFQAWIRGTASNPYTSRVHETLVNVNVDGQTRDYSLTSSDAFASIAAPGVQANYVIRLTTANSGSTKWTGSNLITLSWAKCPTSSNPFALPLLCGIDGSFATTTVPNVDPGEDHTFNVQTTAALSDETYRGWIRATGLDDVTNKRVTHLLEVTLDSAVLSGGATQYVDVLGYAVFQITSLNSNDVNGVAITSMYADPNDPAIAIARKVGLVPWEEP